MTTHSSLRVAVVGAGMGGLSMARKLLDLGYDFTVYEKAEEVGGTWRENHYPGLTVDIPSSIYQLPWAPKYDWTRAYPPGAEIQCYLVETAVRQGIRDRVRFGKHVVRASWDGAWTLSFADGSETVVDAAIMATGFLHHPLPLRVPGLETFRGRAFHTADWPDGVKLKGKRVGVIGTGSSGIQMTSELGFSGSQVYQFVRTPQWVETIRNPRRGWFNRTVSRLVPPIGRRLTARADRGIQQDPRFLNLEWRLHPGPQRAAAIAALKEDLEAVRDPELRAALTPDYTPGCKRIPKSDRYYAAVQLPNVHVVRGGVARVTETGVITGTGETYELDAIVYATGYDTNAFVRPMQVTGAHGVELNEVWRGGPFAYKGVGIPDFPNFFLLNGPFSPFNSMAPPQTLVHQTRYVGRLLARIAESGVDLAPTETATTDFRRLIAEAAADTIWATDCDNWYRTPSGDLLVWPFEGAEYRDMFEELEIDTDFVAEPSARRPASELKEEDA